VKSTDNSINQYVTELRMQINGEMGSKHRSFLQIGAEYMGLTWHLQHVVEAGALRG